MRKWKVFLVMLCAMLVSVGLFACKNDGDSATDIQNITRVTGASDLKYTDEDQWSSILSSLEKSVKLTCRPTEGENVTINGSDCNFTSTIQFDSNNHCVVGNYTLTISPKENNPKNLSRTVDVEVAHAFGTPENNRAICSYCQATNTKIDEDAIIHYGAFHEALTATLPNGVYDEATNYTNNNTTNSQIKEFGTVSVATNGVTEERSIPSLTVGQLEPGMTITVKGTAQNACDKWGLEDAGYYFPVIGFADRFNNTPTFEGKTTSGYVGGTSVFVRGEGWVLYNGIGDESGKTRPLGALSAYATGDVGDGSGTGRNYGSHELAEADSDEVPPASFRPGQVPSVDSWTPWVVYSTGTTHNSGYYSDVTNIELTWNYRQDGIVELIYGVNGTKLVCMVKVEEPTKGYFDTILHGDYVDMHITSYERIETRTPTSFAIEVAKDNYYEGQEFNPETVSATFTYLQSGTTPYPQTLTLANIFATEAASLDGDDIEWVSMETNKVDGKYNFYKVEVEKGGQTWTKTFEKSAINIVANKIESAAGADAANFANNNTVGDLALSTDGTNVIVTPVETAYVQSLAAGAAFANNAPAVGDAANYRYVAVKLGGTLDDITEVTSNTAAATAVPYTYDKTNGTLVLGLTADVKAVKITGMNVTPTIFDFSEAKGFNLSESITIDYTTDTNNWYLNNTANTVTVTFTANEGMTFGRIYFSGNSGFYANPTALVNAVATKDATLGGATVKQGATYNAETRTLTFTVSYPAADLAEYAPRSIRIQVGADYDFEYKIDYVANFVETADTMDEDYYTFVSGNKVYLAALAADVSASNELALNLNAGDDNVSVIDLGYTYNEGVAAFANRSLTGAEIKVLDFANSKVVLIAVDPAAYGITATGAYGYQLLRGENYSEYYFAVSGGTATRTAVGASGEAVIINEGSCLETGLRGTMVGTTDKFIANAVEFAGSHHFASLAANQVCEYCGEKLERVGLTGIGSVTLYDNQYIELSEQYTADSIATAQVDGEWPLYTGIYLRLTVGNTSYRIRNDGWIGNFATNVAATESNITSSLDDTARTPIGKYDSDNLFISGESFLKTLNEGAKFRIWAGYQDGTFTVVWRIYKAKDVTAVMNDYGNVYFEFTHKFANLNRDSVVLSFALDNGAKIAGNGSNNAWWTRGEIDKNMIAAVTELNAATQEPVTTPAADTVTYAVGGIEDHYATVTALGGNAKNADDLGSDALAAWMTKLGITANDGYSKFIAFAVTLSGKYTNSDVALATVLDAQGNKVNGTYTEFNGNNLIVVIALKADATPGVYYLDLVSGDGSSKQIDIKVDLSAVSMFDTTGSVSAVGSFVEENTVTVTYAKVPTGSLKISLNGATAVATAASNMDLGDGVKGAWAANGTNATLTLTIPAQYDLTKVPQYTVRLYQDTKLVTTNIFTLKTPVATDGVYAVADKANLYLYVVGDASTGKEYLVFNANNKTTYDTKKTTILPYDLSFSVNSGSVTFTTANALTKTVAAKNFNDNASFRVTQFKIDLSDFGITESAPYLYTLLTSPVQDGTSYYAVDANRAIQTAEYTNGGDKADIIAVSCTALSSKGYAVMSGDATPVLLGYVALEAGPAHDYELAATGEGLYECSICGAVLASNNATNTAIDKSLLEDASKNGLSFSFLLTGVEGTNDWAYQILHSYAGVNMSLTEIDIWSDHSALGFTGELGEAAERLKNTHAYPSDYADSGYNSVDWQIAGTYVTIVFNADNDYSLDIYADGVLKIRYSGDNKLRNDSATAGDFVQVFLAAAEKFGVTVAPSGLTIQDLIVNIDSLNADEVMARYNLYFEERAFYPAPHTEHHYIDNLYCACGALDPDHTHVDIVNGSTQDYHCDYCGALMDHPHSYNTGSNVCTLCGYVCPHLTVTSNACNECHMTITASELTVNNSNYWNGAQVFATEVQSGQTVTFTAQYTDFTVNEWAGAIIGVLSSTDSKLVINRYIDGWFPDDGIATGITASTSGDMTHNTHDNTTLPNSRLKMVVVYSGGNMTITITKYAAEDTTYANVIATRVLTISGLKGTVKVGFSNADGSKFTDNKVLVRKTEHTHTYDSTTHLCECGEVDPTHTTHTYSNTTDYCVCGEFNPDHGKADAVSAGTALAHNYVEGVCSICKEACEHDFDATTGECSNCDMKKVALSESIYNASEYLTHGTDVTITGWYENCPIVTGLEEGGTVTFTGTLASDCTTVYLGVVVQIWEFGTDYTRANECAFLQGNGWCLTGSWGNGESANATSGNGVIIPGSGTATLESLGTTNRKGMTYEIAVAFSDGVVTVTYKVYNASKTLTHTGVATYTNVTESKLAVSFAPDGTTFEDEITIVSTKVVSKTASSGSED